MALAQRGREGCNPAGCIARFQAARGVVSFQCRLGCSLASTKFEAVTLCGRPIPDFAVKLLLLRSATDIGTLAPQSF